MVVLCYHRVVIIQSSCEYCVIILLCEYCASSVLLFCDKWVINVLLCYYFVIIV